ncbi:MAG TPA: class I SAM-dependent methyltransferase [Burkholderiaceae bacterium]|nr:class I SAM-dependent methyltransferase [Burkholderiaceae bacterium]
MTRPDAPDAPDDAAREASRLTLHHYSRHALRFRDGTWDHDVSQNIDALLRHITASPPFTILDLGCGPGRDLLDFTRRGHRAIGLDGSPEFVAMARQASGCEVWQQDFLDLDLPFEYFDGVFANASLFHVPARHAPDALRRLFRCLKPGGVLCSSNPRGDNQEGWSGERYGTWYDYSRWSELVSGAGFIELECYYRPEGLPRDQQPWLVTVWRKPES